MELLRYVEALRAVLPPRQEAPCLASLLPYPVQSANCALVAASCCMSWSACPRLREVAPRDNAWCR